MENDSSLEAETTAWCERAGGAINNPPDRETDCLGLAREGILLRRRWDQQCPDAPPRRELLRLLPALQSLAQQRLAEDSQASEGVPGSPVALVEAQLAEDDRYLASLLNEHERCPESAAFAVECFRDDLHWLGTQVAVLEGSRGVDFLGRILLEQEALEREIDAWEDGPRESSPGEHGPAGAAELHDAAQRLRHTALSRQIRSLACQPEPQDPAGWYRRWQAASRLAARLDTPSTGPASEDTDAGQETGALREAPTVLNDIRACSAAGWSAGLDALPSSVAESEAAGAAQEMADSANETLTFLEDLTLPQAVQSLETLEEDVNICLRGIQGRAGERMQRARRQLRRRKRAIAAELQERRLAWRMERLFGPRFVARLERLILFLLVVFVILLAAEGPLLRYEVARRGIQLHSGQSYVEPVLAWIDLGICLVFLAEFTLKISLADRRWLYLRRNWLTGLLPAIPVGFLAYATNHPLLAEGGEWFVSLRFLRYLRLPYFARWLRVARPVLRFARLVGFMIRASDRIVRQLTPILNRNLLLFERGAIQVKEPSYRRQLSLLRERFYYRAGELIHDLPPEAGRRVARARIDDLTAMLSSPEVAYDVAAGRVEHSGAREMPLERIIAWLLAATPAGISDRIGRSLAYSVARWSRAFDIFAVRRLPLVRDLVAASRLPSPYDTTAVVANRLGLMLKHLLDRVYWLADLYGTVTAPQLVDSMGEYMVKGAARPAKRLVLVGVGFLAVTYLFSWISDWLPMLHIERVSVMLRELIGWPLIVLGCLCMIVFALGVWFRRIAGEATEFYTQVAQAQFIAATKRLKHRLAKAYQCVLEQRVIAPEMAIARRRTCGADVTGDQSGGMDQVESARGAVDLLWSDYLDGAPFLQDDTRTTNQLLGNLVLVSLRETRLGYDRRRRKELRRLDLSGARMSIRGPYLWFRFISRSLAHQTARLVIDYNAYALPLSRAATADAPFVRGYVEWLGRRLRRPVDQIALPDEIRQRWEAICRQGGEPAASENHHRRFDGNDFTAIHFLSADPELEADIRRRYGDEVAELMRRDRRDNVRRVFRTYPFHHMPKEKRTFNPLVLYQRHLAGGRVMVVPLKILWWAGLLAARALGLLHTVIQDLLEPTVTEVATLEESDPFEVAVRKIHRMRKPLFLECLRMRAEFDPEYLGVTLPGEAAGVRETAAVEIDDDLRIIRAEPRRLAEFRRLAALRRRQMLDFRYWLERLGGRKLAGRSMRAMAIAYTIDYRGARGCMEAVRLVEKAFAEAADPSLGTTRRTGAWSPRILLRRWRLRGRMERLFAQPAFSQIDATHRAACWRAIVNGKRQLVDAVLRLTDARWGERDPLQEARTVLLDVGRDPDPWSRQLVTLRAVQTLSVLDLKAYRDLVAELGEYETSETLAETETRQ